MILGAIRQFSLQGGVPQLQSASSPRTIFFPQTPSLPSSPLQSTGANPKPCLRLRRFLFSSLLLLLFSFPSAVSGFSARPPSHQVPALPFPSPDETFVSHVVGTVSTMLKKRSFAWTFRVRLISRGAAQQEQRSCLD